MRRIRGRWILAAAALVGLGVLAAVAFIALEPSFVPRADSGTATCFSNPPPSAAATPCSAPGGFEVFVTNIKLASRRVTLDVSFRNNTPGGGFEAVSYRHSSTVDFTISGTDGAKRKPLIDAGCPNWEEARVERGGRAGPDKLCFDAPASGLSGAHLWWTPDLGVFPVTGSVPLG